MSVLQTSEEILPDEKAQELVHFFKLLADETRLRILYFLKHRGELNVQTLCHLLGQSQPSVSHHLALLRVAGLIEMRRDGKHNFYRTIPRRFGELIEMMFETLPEKSSEIRFDDKVLSYSLAEDLD
jgi:ArsR family transcriptional regulator